MNIFKYLGIEIIDDTRNIYKARKSPVRRTNGQVARKIPVKDMGKVIYYIYK